MNDFINFMGVVIMLGSPIVFIAFWINKNKVKNWFYKTNKRQKNIIRFFSIVVPALPPTLLYLEYTRE
jgi:magnesium-transporting ATPase (P-type)